MGLSLIDRSARETVGKAELPRDAMAAERSTRIGMKSRTIAGVLLALLTLSPALFAQNNKKPDSAAKQNKNFDRMTARS